MGIPIPVEFSVDQQSATAAANRAERIFSDAGRDASQQFSRAFGQGSQDVDQQMRRMGDRASDAYDRARDATGRLAAEQARLTDLQERSNTTNAQLIQQQERLERARRAEIRAVRDATNAYQEYEQAAESAGENAGEAAQSGLRNALSGIGEQGRDAADSFVGGFSGASALLRIGALGGPIGLALAGVGVLGLMAGKVLGDAIVDGLATIQMQDAFQARMGLDEVSMAQYADAAGAAYANNFGESVAENLSAAQVAMQTGLIDSQATEAEVQTVVEQLQGLTSITDASSLELSRSIAQLMRTGLAGSVSEASDIIVSGFQQGLDVSGDWLDTINEYSTQFRKLGLDAASFMTLLKQGLQGGARDTDLVADSMKEFAIRAVDGSKSTQEGFEALGFNADEMGRRFAAGGESAKVALAATLDALKRIDDPMQKGLIWQRLFGTQWEDMGDAINNFDLSKVGQEFDEMKGTSDRATKTASENWSSEWDSAMKTVKQTLSEMKVWLADWVTSLPIIKDLPAWIKAMAETPTAATGYTATYDGQQVVPVTGPSPDGGVVAPASGAIKGDGTFLGNLLDGSAGQSAPSGLNAPGVGGQVPASLAPPPPPPIPPPVQGELHPIATDAEEEALKESRKASETAEKQYMAEQKKLADEQRDTWKKMESTASQFKTGMGEIGAALDQDFGISEGLPGIAKNLVTFLANLAMAPIQGMLQGVVNASGYDPSKHGSGLFGIFGGMFGGAGGGAPGMSGGSGGSAGYGGGVGAMLALAQAASGKTAYGPASDLVNGLADCSGSISDLYEVLTTGQSSPARMFTTTNFASDAEAAKLGFLPGYMPGALNVGVNPYPGQSGHMAATLPNGVNFEGGGGTGGGAQYGGSAAGALDPQFEKHYYFPTGASGPMPGGSPSGGSSLASSAGGATPVFVVNMPGGGLLGGGQPAAPTSPSGGAPSAPSAPSAPGSAPALAPLPAPSYAPLAPDVVTSPGLASPVPITSPGPSNAQVPAAPSLPGMPGGGAPLSPGLLGVPGGGGAGTGAAAPGLFGVPQGLSLPGAGGGGGGGGLIGMAGDAAKTAISDQAYPAQGGSGAAGVGGLPLDALMSGAAALNSIAPGAGAAAQIGIQLGNRFAGFLGQDAGIGVSGLLETILPAGDNPMASIGNSWIGKIFSGFAGARPALPNMAGSQPAPPNPNDGSGQPGPQGNTTNNNITVNNSKASEDQNGQAVAEQIRVNTPAGGGR